MKRNNKKGFTIVELVIVIAVIAILSAVLIPTFGGVIDQANKSTVEQAARNSYTEIVAYDLAQDNTLDGDIDATKYPSTKVTYSYDTNGALTYSYTDKGYTVSYNGSAWSTSTNP